MKKNSDKILNILLEKYSDAKCELEFNSPYELLVAVILSAQCTDKRVNIVTKKLFEEYNTPEKMIMLTQSQLEQKIHACGFFRNKAKHILQASKGLIEKFDGNVPKNKEKLKSLAGVGEKTANVVLATAFDIPAIAVDTHVFRVSNRLGLAKAKNVTLTQKQLEKAVPKQLWAKIHYGLVLHGRYVCKSQKPKCENCELKDYCCYFLKKSLKLNRRNYVS